ncbi:titin homolog isoform X2 [Palaemon carinicauda]|uniref:titin homolog isoform X2 n=1 Tax=Palaemon carinicauda TaxID=392227 RepID=UPI0035B58BAC
MPKSGKNESQRNLRTYSSIKDVAYEGVWLKEGNDIAQNPKRRIFLMAAYSACAEHRWEDAAEILPLLFLDIDTIPLDMLLSFTNAIVRNNDSLSGMKDTIYKSFIPWLSTKYYIIILGMICDELPNIKHEDFPAFTEEIYRLLTKAMNISGRKNLEKIGRFQYLTYGYTALTMYYYYRNDYELEWGDLQFSSEIIKLDEDFHDEKMERKEEARKKALMGIKSAVEKFSLALGMFEEPCEWLMEPYLHALQLARGTKAALDKLEEYVENNSSHLPAHRLAYQFLKSCPDTEELQQKKLEEIVKLCPDDPLVITYVEDLLEKDSDVETLIKVINLLMDMIEFREWRWNVEPWKTLCYAIRNIHAQLKCGPSQESAKIMDELRNIVKERTPLWKAYVWNVPTFSRISFDQAEILFYSTYVAFVLQYDKAYTAHMEKAFVDYGFRVLVEDLENAKNFSGKHVDSFLENFTAYKNSQRSLYGKEGVFDNVKIQNSDSNNMRMHGKSLKCNFSKNSVSLGIEKSVNGSDFDFNSADFVTSTQVLDSSHKIPLSKEREMCKSSASIDLYQDSFSDFGDEIPCGQRDPFSDIGDEIPCGQKDPLLEKEENKKWGPDHRNYIPELFDHNSVISQKKNYNEQHSSSDSNLSDMESVIPPSQPTDLTFSSKKISKSFSKTEKDLLDIAVDNSDSETDMDIGNATFNVRAERPEKRSERWRTSGLNKSCHQDLANPPEDIKSFVDESSILTDVEPLFQFVDMNDFMDESKHKIVKRKKQNSISKSEGKKTCGISLNHKLPGQSLPIDELMSTVKVKTELRDDDEICAESPDKTKSRKSNSFKISNNLSTYEVEDQSVPPYSSKMKSRNNDDTKNTDCEMLKTSGNKTESSLKHFRLTDKDRGSLSNGQNNLVQNQSSLTNESCKSKRKKKLDIPESSSAKRRRISAYALDDLPFPEFPSQDINDDEKFENDYFSINKDKVLVEENCLFKKKKSFLGIGSRVPVDVNTSCNKERQRENESVENKIVHAKGKEKRNAVSQSSPVFKSKKSDIDKTEKSKTPKSSLKKFKRISGYEIDDLPFPVFPSQITEEDNDGLSNQNYNECSEANTLVGQANENNKLNAVGTECKEIYSGPKEKDVSCGNSKQNSSQNISLLPIKSQKSHNKKDVTPKNSLKKYRKSIAYEVGELTIGEFESQTILGECAKLKVSDKTPKECILKSGKYSTSGKKQKKNHLSSTKKHLNTSSYEGDDLPFPDFDSQAKLENSVEEELFDKTPKGYRLKSDESKSQSKKKKKNTYKGLLNIYKELLSCEVDDLPFPNFESQTVLKDEDELKFSGKRNNEQALDSAKCMGQSKFELQTTFEDKKEVDEKKPFEKILDKFYEYSSSSKRKNKKSKSSLKKQQETSAYDLDDLPFPVFESQCVLEKSDEKENYTKTICDPVSDFEGQSPVLKNEKFSSKKEKKKASKSLERFTNKKCESTQIAIENSCEISRKLGNVEPEKDRENGKRSLSQESIKKNIECENFQTSVNYVEENSKVDSGIKIKQEKEDEDSFDDFICIPRYIKSDGGVGRIVNEVHTLDSSVGDVISDYSDPYSEVEENPSCKNQHLLGDAYPDNVAVKKNNMKFTKTHLFCSTPVESASVSKKSSSTVLKGEENTKRKLENLNEEVGSQVHMDLDDNDISKISYTVGTKRVFEKAFSPQEAHQTKRLKTKDFSLAKSNPIESESPVFTTKKSCTVGTKTVFENKLTPQEERQAKRLKSKDFSLLKSDPIKSETPVFASRCKSKLGKKKLFTPGGISNVLDGSKNKSSLLYDSGCKVSFLDSPETKMVDMSAQKKIGKIIGNDNNITKDKKAKSNREIIGNGSKGLAWENNAEVVLSGIKITFSQLNPDDSCHNSVSVKKKKKMKEEESHIGDTKIKNKTKKNKSRKTKLKKKVNKKCKKRKNSDGFVANQCQVSTKKRNKKKKKKS